MHLNADDERRLRQLVKVFLDENQNLNLSAHRTADACWVLNVMDSLALLDALPSLREWSGERGAWNVADVGTGGGFPALPLAIVKPEWKITAFDATRKKIEAVERIVARLQAPGARLQVRCLVGRAEELGHREDLRETFDLVLARAVAELPVLLELMSPFARTGGLLVCWKSMGVEEELRESEKAQRELLCVYRGDRVYDLGGKEGRRQLLIFEKTGSAPEVYPRRVGVPKKKPLW